MPPLRITFVTPAPMLGGGIRAVAIYAVELQRLGHDVSIVSTGPVMLSWWRRFKNLVRGKGWWRPSRGPTHFDHLTTIPRKTLSRYRPIVATDVRDADIVIATWWETAEWVAALPAAKGAKVYFVQHHEVVFNSQPVDRVRASYRLPMQKICCASWLKDLMKTEYGDATAAYVPYGVDHALFSAPERSKQQRPTVGFMYARASFKGIDVAARAIELARERVPDLRVVAFGEQTIHEDCPLPPGIEFDHQPSQSRIAQTYAACDAWLFPSKCEGFGLPILEAMACRTPVIGTPTGIAPDVIGEGGGLLVPMSDAQAMADAIVAISEMPTDQWRQLSDSAFATAQRFRWDSSALAFERCLKDVVSDNRA